MDPHKTQIEEKIVQKMIAAVGEGTLTEEELPDISSFVLDHLEPVTNGDQMIGFLHTLSLKWPVFANIATEEEGVLKDLVAKNVAKNVLSLIKKGDFTQAVSIAQQVTQK